MFLRKIKSSSNLNSQAIKWLSET